MATPRRLRFLYGTMAWLLATLVVLTAVGSFSLELFFVCSLLGVLIVAELTAPFNVTPRWRWRLRAVIAVGLVAFGLIVLRRLLEILPPEVLPT